jgi:hypothetical protein
MKSSFSVDKKWANKCLPEVKKILRQYTLYFLEFLIAGYKKATDMILKTSGGDVALRIRRGSYTKYRDLTIRSFRSSGQKTELEKLRDGFAHFYLYLWTDGASIVDWILVDLDKARKTGLLYKQRHHFDNKDGTYFVAIPVSELKRNDCLIATKNHQFKLPLLTEY